MPHLVVSISGHGFGHVSQTASILSVLHEGAAITAEWLISQLT